jgi:hypothetical protein
MAAPAFLWLASCNKDINNKDAVRNAVVDYLKSRSDFGLDLNQMDIEVSSLSFQKDQAQATIYFRPKQGGAEGIPVKYVLDRKGNEWVVRSRGSASGGGHNMGKPLPGEGAETPKGAMPPRNTPAEMPKGHPPVDKK